MQADHNAFDRRPLTRVRHIVCNLENLLVDQRTSGIDIVLAARVDGQDPGSAGVLEPGKHAERSSRQTRCHQVIGHLGINNANGAGNALCHIHAGNTLASDRAHRLSPGSTWSHSPAREAQLAGEPDWPVQAPAP